MQNYNNNEFKDIPGYANLYQITKNGIVKSFQNRNGVKVRLLKLKVDDDGYFKVTLYLRGVRKDFFVHRLVALTYISNPQNLPQINHKDGHKKNNNVDNLEWVTPLQNSAHAIRTKLIDLVGSKNPNAKLKEGEVIELRKLYGIGKISIRKLAKAYNINYRYLSDIIAGDRCWSNLPIFHDKNDPYKNRRHLNETQEKQIIELYSTGQYYQMDLARQFNVTLKVINRTLTYRKLKLV